MPKKFKKTKEESTVEDYFRVDKRDLDYATEKKIKQLKESPIEIIEKPYSKKTSSEKVEKKTIKKTKKKTSKPKEYKIPNIKLKNKGYELIITEKPQAANKIANALGKAVQKNINKISYYEVKRNGKEIRVACAVGHLFTLHQNKKGTEVPIFDISWAPNYLVRKKDFTKKYYDTILKLAKDASEITIATDYDVEGEVIGRNVMQYICNQNDASRMKFSTLTKNELNNAYENKLNYINWGQATAGETRHFLDWFYGINLSRALMNAIKTTGKFKIMSIGRVQGPALKLIVNKEKVIQAFKSKSFWQVFIRIDDEIKGLELKHNKDIFDKKKLTKFKELKGKKASVETTNKEQELEPGVPFNLTNLQTEAYKFYGITPSQTLKIAQGLYLAGLISYPRTSSQKLPSSIDYKEILKELASKFNAEHLIKRKSPIEGKKEDSAHPSIYPTGQEQILSGDDEKIYKLIVKRFLSLFCENAIIDNRKVTAEIDNLKFTVKGQVIKKKAWLEIYPSKLKEEKIPEVKGEKEILNVRTEEKETQPPKRFSPASIVSELEKRNLGTKATRSSILETLYDRGYIEGQSIKATPLGISLIETLEKYSPIITDEKLTRNFEKNIESISSQDNKEKLEKKEKEITEKAKKTITDIAKDFDKNDKKIGKELVSANAKFREQQKIENQIMKCPKCGKGHLAITYSKKNKRFFIACDAYPDCQNTFPLPPNGVIKKTDKVCEECGYPMLMRLSKGRKPWIFCWNPECPTNASWAKKKEE